MFKSIQWQQEHFGDIKAAGGVKPLGMHSFHCKDLVGKKQYRTL